MWEYEANCTIACGYLQAFHTNTWAISGIPSLFIFGGDRAPIEKVCNVLADIMSAQRAVIAGYGHAPHYSGNRPDYSLLSFLAPSPSVLQCSQEHIIMRRPVSVEADENSITTA